MPRSPLLSSPALPLAALSALAILLYLSRRRRLKAKGHPLLNGAAANGGGGSSSSARVATAADIEWLASADAEADDFLEVQEANDPFQRLYVLPGPYGQPIAAASLLMEPKCLRAAMTCCHICEVLRDATRATAATREALLQSVLEIARGEGCYKAIMDAPPADVPLLRACGFEPNSLTMGLSLVPKMLPPEEDGFSNYESVTPKELACAKHTYTLRPLHESDEYVDYIALLSQLSQAPAIGESTFMRQLGKFRKADGRHLVLVVDRPGGRPSKPLLHQPPALIGSITLLFEWLPPSNGLGRIVMRIEDVVVDASARGTGLGRALIAAAIEIGVERGAHTATLNCSEANEPFYTKCGFERSPGGLHCWAKYLMVTRVSSHTDEYR